MKSCQLKKRKDAVKMRNALKLCYFDHSWTGWFRLIFFFWNLLNGNVLCFKASRDTVALSEQHYPFSLYVSSQRYCSVWGWSSLPEGGQAIGATACLRKEKLQLDIPVSISHFQTKLLIPDWLTTAENKLFLSLLTTKFTIASTSSACTASAPD